MHITPTRAAIATAALGLCAFISYAGVEAVSNAHAMGEGTALVLSLGGLFASHALGLLVAAVVICTAPTRRERAAMRRRLGL